MTEIRIHRTLEHTNIVKFRRYFKDDEAVYILLEICNNQVRSSNFAFVTKL